ncbi:MAG: serine hydrolase [Candidatus Aminicenantes bacterium]|nr:serine hydrolase [Candidatus Aminicenantes bacterium]
MKKKCLAVIPFYLFFITSVSFSSPCPTDKRAGKTLTQLKEKTIAAAQVSYNWPQSPPEAQGFNSEIFEKASRHAEKLGFVNSLLVVRNGYLIHEEYFNGIDKDTPQKIASVSKSFIGALVGIALREGLMTLDQKMIDFYPDYVTPNMDPRKNDITIRHLLQMLGGFWDVDTMYSSNRIKYAIEYIPLYSDPGTAFHYSTIGVHLLSGIITRSSGMSTLDFAQMFLFDPLEISVAAWSQDPAGIYTGGFGMEFTPRNMARFGYLYLQEGEIKGIRIISENYHQESRIPSDLSENELAGCDAVQESGYGYLWWIAKMGDTWTYLARGSGGQYIIVIPELKMVIVLTGKVLYYSAFHHVANFRLFAYLILYPIRDWLGDPPFAPDNVQGAKRINRSLAQVEYVNEITWESSSRNQGLGVIEYRIYNIHSASKKELLAKVDPGTCVFLHRGSEVQKESEHIYGITAVTNDLKESIPAFVIIYSPEEGEYP